MKVIENQTATLEMAQTFTKHFHQFLLSFHANDQRWHKIQQAINLFIYACAEYNVEFSWAAESCTGTVATYKSLSKDICFGS
jgi:hypothetical protein